MIAGHQSRNDGRTYLAEVFDYRVREILREEFARARESAGHRIYNALRTAVSDLLHETPQDPFAVAALDALDSGSGSIHQCPDGPFRCVLEEEEYFYGFGSVINQLLAIGLASRTDLKLPWLVQNVVDPEGFNSGPDDQPATWADIGAVLGMAGASAQEMFGLDSRQQVKGPEKLFPWSWFITRAEHVGFPLDPNPPF